jgi:hypothetical protein
LRTVPEDADRDIAHVLPALFAALTT